MPKLPRKPVKLSAFFLQWLLLNRFSLHDLFMTHLGVITHDRSYEAYCGYADQIQANIVISPGPRLRFEFPQHASVESAHFDRDIDSGMALIVMDCPPYLYSLFYRTEGEPHMPEEVARDLAWQYGHWRKPRD